MSSPSLAPLEVHALAVRSERVDRSARIAAGRIATRAFGRHHTRRLEALELPALVALVDAVGEFAGTRWTHWREVGDVSSWATDGAVRLDMDARRELGRRADQMRARLVSRLAVALETGQGIDAVAGEWRAWSAALCLHFAALNGAEVAGFDAWQSDFEPGEFIPLARL